MRSQFKKFNYNYVQVINHIQIIENRITKSIKFTCYRKVLKNKGQVFLKRLLPLDETVFFKQQVNGQELLLV